MTASIIIRPPNPRHHEERCHCCPEPTYTVMEFISGHTRFQIRLCDYHFVELQDVMKGRS